LGCSAISERVDDGALVATDEHWELVEPVLRPARREDKSRPPVP
jgi:hypothetical protein